MDSYERVMAYHKQNKVSKLTPKQRRRNRKKFNLWEKRFLRSL